MEQLTYVPGLLGELIEWNVRTARYPSRVMALAAAIAVVGKLLDRKVAGPTMSGTHLYTVVLGPTGSGKQHQLDVVKTLLTAAGMGDSIGPGDFSSVQALQQLIKEKNSCISVMDEFGSFLRRIKDGHRCPTCARSPGRYGHCGAAGYSMTVLRKRRTTRSGCILRHLLFSA